VKRKKESEEGEKKKQQKNGLKCREELEESA